jgi:hypothetical protein
VAALAVEGSCPAGELVALTPLVAAKW